MSLACRLTSSVHRPESKQNSPYLVTPNIAAKGGALQMCIIYNPLCLYLLYDSRAVESNRNLWNYLYQGEKCFQHQDESIFIMGDARVGKSTFFNWLRGIPLRGVKKGYDIFYEAAFDEAAKARLTFQPLHAIPNKDEVDVNKRKMKVYDFAGFGDSRGYAEVFAGLLMIQYSVRFIEKVKFILVIESPWLTLNHAKNRMMPFLHFTTMFKEDLLADEEALNNFIHSVVLVLTKADRQQKEYLSRANDIANFLDKKTDPESVLLAKMIQNIVDNQRLFLFPTAQEGTFASECKLLEEMNMQQKNWQYYGWKQNHKYIYLPFKSQFRRLEDSEQDDFQREIQFKQGIFAQSCQILNNCALKTTQKFKNNSLQYTEYTEEFRQMQQLIKKYNAYGNFQSSKIERAKSREPEKNVSMLKIFKSLDQVFQIISQILWIYEGGSLASLHECQRKCQQLFTHFRDTLCSCESEQTIFLNFAFLILQAITEFGHICYIDDSMGCDALQTIKQGLNKLMTGSTYSEANYEFLINFQTQSIEEHQEVIEEILKFLKKNYYIKNLEKSSILMRKIVQLYINQAQSFKNRRQFQKGVEMLLKAWSYVQRQPSEQEENIKMFEERVAYFTYRIFSKIGDCLLGLNLFDLAIKVFEKLKFVDEKNTGYQKNFEKERDLGKKYSKMLEYEDDQFYFLFPTKKEEISNSIYEFQGSQIKEKYAEYKNTLFDKVKFDIQEELITQIQTQVKKCQDEVMSVANTAHLQEAYLSEDSMFEKKFVQDVEPVENSVQKE